MKLYDDCVPSSDPHREMYLNHRKKEKRRKKKKKKTTEKYIIILNILTLKEI